MVRSVPHGWGRRATWCSRARWSPPHATDGVVVILLTRLGGPAFALNQDLIERADCTPDTVVTLVDGTKYVITESLRELVELIRCFRASVITEAQWLERHPGPVAAIAAVPSPSSRPEHETPAAVVQLHRREP
jgi:flagellar protein FlbD